jgi:hypothetical protein
MGLHHDFTWIFDRWPVYWVKDEEFDKAGTVCALFDIVITVDGLGSKGISHGACAADGQHAAKIMNYATA